MAPSTPGDRQLDELKVHLERERSARREAEARADRATRASLEQQRALTLLHDIATTANQAACLDEALAFAVDRVCAHLGWPVGHVYLLADGREELVSSGIWHLEEPERYAPLRAVSETARFRTGLGLPGRVLASRAPLWIVDVSREAHLLGAPVPMEVGLKTALGFPVLTGSEVSAVMEFFSPTASEPDAGVLAVLTDIGSVLGRVIERTRAAALLQAAQDSLDRRVEERTRQLEAVRAVMFEIARESDPGVVLAVINRRAAELVGATYGIVWLWNAQEQILRPGAWHGVSDRIAQLTHRLGEGVSGTVAARRTGMVVNDYASSPYIDRALPSLVAGSPPTGVVAEPMLDRDRLVGVIVVGSSDPRHRFTEADRQLLSVFADQAAVAIEKARLHDEAVRRAAQLVDINTRLEAGLDETAALLEIARVVGSTIDRREALRLICRELARLTNADTVSAHIRDAQRDALLPVGAYHMPPAVLRELAVAVLPLGNQGFAPDVFGAGRIVWTDEVPNDPRFSFPLVRRFPHQSALVLPLVLDREIAGAFYLAWWTERRTFSERELATLDAISRQVGALLRNARLYEVVEDRAARLHALAGVNRLVSSSLDLHEVLAGIAQAASELMHTPVVSFWTVDESQRRLRLAAFSRDAPAENFPVQEMSFGQGGVGWVAEHRQALNVPDVFAPGSIIAGQEWLHRHGFTSFMGVPVVSRSALLAVLALNGRRPFALTPADQEALDAFVDQAGIAVHNAALHAEIVAARDAAEVATRAKSEFLAAMSHEIRTPMNGVLGMTHLLLESELSASQQEYAQTIKQSGEDLLAIIGDILDLAKIEAGKLVVDHREFDLREAVEGVLALQAAPAAAKGVELISQIAPDLPAHVMGDPVRLRQVLNNVVSNAVKFTERGEIVVRIGRIDGSQGGTLRCEVEDTGIGIAPEAMARLFQAFSQVAASPARRQGGTGLGLAISAQIVDLMGGRIGVDSRPGQGSTFWFSLPLEASPSPAVPEPPLRARILVADLSPAGRESVLTPLRAWGLEAEGVRDLATALCTVRAASQEGRPFALALLDVRIAEADPVTFAEAIAELGLRHDLKIVLLAAPHSAPFEDLRPTVAAHLTKPVRHDALRGCLRRLLAAAPEVRARAGAATSSLPRRVLVAEDNPTNQKVLASMLRAFGCELDIVDHGQAAIEAVQRRAYDVVLMDCQMPIMDGLEAAREIRRREPAGQHTPIVAVTASALRGERERCERAGMDDYLTKPVDPKALGAVLDRWTGRPERTGPSPPPVLDATRLAELGGLPGSEDEAFVAELIDMFLSEATQHVEATQAALDRGDSTRLRAAAHALKGSSLAIGALELATLAGGLEDLAERGHLGGATTRTGLVGALARARQALGGHRRP